MFKRSFHLKVGIHMMMIYIVITVSLLTQSCGLSAQTASSNNSGLVPISLSSYVNNKGIGSSPGQANLDGSGYAYPADQLPQGGQRTLNGVPYLFPTSKLGVNDNVVALGQTINLPQGNYLQAFLLVTATYGSAGGMATVHYSDGLTSSASLSVPDWLATSDVVNTSYRYAPTAIDQSSAHIYAVEIGMDWTKTANALTLPSTAQPSPNQPSLHVFALTLQHAVQGYAAKVLDAHSTTKMMAGTSTAQVVALRFEAVRANAGTWRSQACASPGRHSCPLCLPPSYSRAW